MGGTCRAVRTEAGDGPPGEGFRWCGWRAMGEYGTLVQLHRSRLAVLSEVKCRYTTAFSPYTEAIFL